MYFATFEEIVNEQHVKSAFDQQILFIFGKMIFINFFRNIALSITFIFVKIQGKVSALQQILINRRLSDNYGSDIDLAEMIDLKNYVL